MQLVLALQYCQHAECCRPRAVPLLDCQPGKCQGNTCSKLRLHDALCTHTRQPKLVV
jgi:hypothetical protein